MRQPKPPKAPEAPDKGERLRWLLDFIQRDLAALRPGERLDLTADCDRLLHWRDPSIDLASVEPPDSFAFELSKLNGAPDVSYFDALVLNVQASLKIGVEHLEAKRSWKPIIKDALQPVFTVQNDNTIARHYRGSYGAIMLASAVDLLVEGWPSLKRCELSTCKRLFLPDDGRKRFHETKCGNLSRFRSAAAKRKPRDYVREEQTAARRDLERKKKTTRQPIGNTRRTT